MNSNWFRRLIMVGGSLLWASHAAADPVITGTSASKTSANTGATLRVFCTDCGHATDRVYFPGFAGNFVNPTAWSLNSYVDVRVPQTSSGDIQLQKQGVGALSAGYPHEISFSWSGLKWPTSTFTWHLNSAGAPGVDFTPTFNQVHLSFNAWTCASGIDRFYGGTTAVATSAFDGVNVFYWKNTGWVGAPISQVTQWFNVAGDIVETDVAFNSQHYTWSTGSVAGSMYIWSAATSAQGQMLGLRNLYGAADAEKTMYGFGDHVLPAGGILTTLHADDALGAEFIYPHTRANLRADGSPAGWYAGVTPRSTADATFTLAPLPATLPSTATSYVNTAHWNDGGDCAAPGGENEILLDGVPAFSRGWGNFIGVGEVEGTAINVPLTVRGGRHTLTHVLDVEEETLESDEGDNDRDFQYVWAPSVLADQGVLASAAPPLPGTGTDENCIGVQGTGNWWGCLASMPQSVSDDYDMLLFNDYAGSLTGFQTRLESSFSSTGQSDFVLWNGNIVGQNSVYEGGVTRYSTVAAAGVNIHFSREVSSMVVPALAYASQVSTPTITIGGSEVVKVHEVYLSSTTAPYRFTLDNLTGTADLNISLYAANVATFRKSEYLSTSFSTGPGTDKEIEYQPTVAGFYAVVVWKQNANDLGLTNTYELRVGPGLSNLTAQFLLPGATAPNVARADAWTTGPLTVSPTLPGETPTTRLYTVFRFEGPTAIPAYDTRTLLDDEEELYVNEVAIASPLTFVTGLSPMAVRGGRHTVGQEVDVTSAVLESVESDNDSENQYVWDPAAAADLMPLSLIAPPVPGSGIHPNSSGRRYMRAAGFGWVSALAATTPLDDYDLYLYDDYSSSTAGFSNLRKASGWGSNQTEFVVGAFTSTPNTFYPAAVRYAANGGGAGFWFDHSNDAGRFNSGTGFSWRDQSLPSGRLADVYGVLMSEGQQERFVLWRQSGSDDIAFALFKPTAGGVFSRSDALENSTQWGSERDTMVFTATTAGWHPLVVYRPDGTEANTALTYTIGWDDEQILDAPGAGGPATLALAGPYPNPARSGSRLSFTLPQAGRATLELYDVDGRKRATLADGEFAAGQHERVLPGGKLAPGLYWARLQAEGRTLSRRVTVLGE